MRLWQKLWLLFTVIWVVVAALNAVTIVAFAEGVEVEKAWWPVALGILVPAAAYGLAWAWAKIRGQSPNSEGEQD